MTNHKPRQYTIATDADLAPGARVLRRTDGTAGEVLGITSNGDQRRYVIRWIGGKTGGGWFASDLLLTMHAADAAIAKFARDADHARALRAVKLAKIRQACRASAAVAIAEWHADEIEAEIARVMSAGCDVAKYRAISREGAAHPLGAREKIAFFGVLLQLDLGSCAV